jgi:hypothetical protein
MSEKAFDDLINAWQKAQQKSSLPGLEAVQKAGGPLNHPRFAVIGAVEDVRRGKTCISHQVLQAGPDHEALGGHPMTGHRIDEIVHHAHVDRLNQLYASIVKSEQPHRWRCVNMARNAPPMSYTRLLVPIADDVGDGRCLAGIWVWQNLGAAR